MTKTVNTMRNVQLYNLSRLIRQVLLGLAAVLFVLTPVASPVLAATCAKDLSQLDCQALTSNWTDWVPLGCASNNGSTNLTGTDNLMKIMNYFVSKGYKPAWAAGIAGNIE